MIESEPFSSDAGVPTRAQDDTELTCEMLLEAAPDALLVLDDAATIRIVNRRTERLFGYERSDLVGEPVEVLMAARAADAYSRLRRSFCADPRLARPLTGILTGRRKDGSEFAADVSFSAVQVGRRTWAAVAVREIAETGGVNGVLQVPEPRRRRAEERRSLLSLLAEAQEGERRRIADEIHEDSIQVLNSVGLRLHQLRRRVDSPELVGVVDQVDREVKLATRRLRRLMFELRPRILHVEGLVAALRAYLSETAEEAPISYELLDQHLLAEPDPESRTIMFRIAQEALTNVRKHSRASRVRVVVESSEGGFLTTIADDGVGFEPGRVVERPTHAGLASMRERAEMSGGRFEVQTSLGRGTTVRVWLPEAGR